MVDERFGEVGLGAHVVVDGLPAHADVIGQPGHGDPVPPVRQRASRRRGDDLVAKRRAHPVDPTVGPLSRQASSVPGRTVEPAARASADMSSPSSTSASLPKDGSDR